MGVTLPARVNGVAWDDDTSRSPADVKSLGFVWEVRVGDERVFEGI